MVSPESITNATLETIDSLLLVVQQQYDRSKESRQRHGSRSTLFRLTDATNQLNMVQRKKQELLDKKKLMVF